MLCPARMVPALMGMALPLASPALAQTQGQEPSHAHCEVCQTSNQNVPVVHEPNNLIGRLLGRRKVTIPAGHYIDDGSHPLPDPVAGWDPTVPAPPVASAMSARHAVAGRGHAVVGQETHAPAAIQAPGVVYSGPASPVMINAGPASPVMSGEPAPIGVMRTSYAQTSPSPAAMVPNSGPVPVSRMPAPGMASRGAMPGQGQAIDPSIWAWHAYGVAEDPRDKRSGPLGRLLGLSGLSKWAEARRERRAQRWAVKHGMYNPSMSAMPDSMIFGR